MEGKGEDTQSTVGPFIDEADTRKLILTGESKRDVAVGQGIPSYSPILRDLSLGSLEELTRSVVTVKVSGSNKKVNNSREFTAAQLRSTSRQRNSSESSDDFLVFDKDEEDESEDEEFVVFEKDGGDESEEDDESESCCSDDQTTTTDCECSDVDDDIAFEEPDSASRCNNNLRATSSTMECNQVKPRKKVTFDDSNLCTTYSMIKWSYAYQAARKGPWEMHARDRSRFQDRVFRSANILNKVLDPAHRIKVYQSRFCTD